MGESEYPLHIYCISCIAHMFSVTSQGENIGGNGTLNEDYPCDY